MWTLVCSDEIIFPMLVEFEPTGMTSRSESGVCVKYNKEGKSISTADTIWLWL